MNSIAFELFGISIYWYGIIMATAILVAFLVCAFLMRRLNYKDDIPFELLLAVVPIGVLGARLYYIIFSGESLSKFFEFRNGGIAIYGAVLAGALGLFIYTQFIRKCSFFAIADILVIGLIIAQSIGRWGNYFNQEVYGLATGKFHFFPLTVLGIDGDPHLALFFYESILNLIGFVVLLKVFGRQKKLGTTSAVYLIYYGIVRAVLEPLREASYTLMIGPIPVSVAVSVLLIGLGILVLYFNKLGKIPQKNARLLKENK